MNIQRDRLNYLNKYYTNEFFIYIDQGGFFLDLVHLNEFVFRKGPQIIMGCRFATSDLIQN